MVLILRLPMIRMGRTEVDTTTLQSAAVDTMSLHEGMMIPTHMVDIETGTIDTMIESGSTNSVANMGRL
jgi:hypothetical protein